MILYSSLREALKKRSWWHPLGTSLPDLVQFHVRSLCGGLAEIPLKRSLHWDLGVPLHCCLYDILFCGDADRKFLYEDLVSSSILLYIDLCGRLQLRSCLTSGCCCCCCCSIATVAVSGTLTSYPPHCLGSLAGVFFKIYHCRIANFFMTDTNESVAQSANLTTCRSLSSHDSASINTYQMQQMSIFFSRATIAVDLIVCICVQVHIEYGYMDIWIYWYMDIWVYGYMDIYRQIYQLCISPL